MAPSSPPALQPTAAASAPAHLQRPLDGEKPLLWDIFCQVIDNYGDVGVCWRLAADLARRGHSVRLWLDDKRALQWMAPAGAQGDWPGISVHDWPSSDAAPSNPPLPLADVWIEAFGCNIPPAWLQTQVNAAKAYARRPAWINLEYLSAESFALRSHGLASPVLQGPAGGWTKYFFYPGFSPASAGLLRGAPAQTASSSWAEPALAAFAPQAPGERTVLLFSYASAPIAALMEALRRSAQAVQILVAAGPGADAVRRALAILPDAPVAPVSLGDITDALNEWHWGSLRLRFLPFLPQNVFDQLLTLCDLNLVRGEDSLAQAVQTGKPCVWQIYPQDDGVHQAKLQAYLDAIAADTPLRAWHSFWNGTPAAAPAAPQVNWPWEPTSTWPHNAAVLAARLAQNTDVCSQLIEWAMQHGARPPAGQA